MDALAPVNVDMLTDDEVVRRYCTGQIDQPRLEALFTQAREQAAGRLRAEGRLNRQDQARLVQQIDELQRAWFNRLIELAMQRARSYFTMEEMRTIVQFQLDYPELHTRIAEFGIQFGPVLVSELFGLQTALDEAIQEVETSIRIQYNA